jgi:hypothetical protein
LRHPIAPAWRIAATWSLHERAMLPGRGIRAPTPFAFGQLKEHDLLSVKTEAEKYLMLAAINLIDCIAATAPTRKPAQAPRPGKATR